MPKTIRFKQIARPTLKLQNRKIELMGGFMGERESGSN